MAESLRHQEAFDFYYTLGDDRSYVKVAQHFNVTPACVTGWAKKYAWQRRVAERDHKLALRMQRETDRQILEDRKSYRIIIKKSIETYFNALKNNKIHVNKVADLKALIEIDLKLMEVLDGGTANVINNNISISGDASETISRLSDELAGIKEPVDLEDGVDA